MKKVLPKKIALPLNTLTEIVLGDSRVIEILFYSGNDSLRDKNFKSVTERGIEWELSPKEIISIDKYGRLETLKEGSVEVTVRSTADSNISTTKKINVVKAATIDQKPEKNIVNFTGKPANTVKNLQKIVERKNKQETELLNIVFKNTTVQENSVLWTIEDFADGSDGKYVMRVDSSLSNRDKVQCFIGDRYLPGNGKNPELIADDGENGIWVLGEDGDSTHIKMIELNYKDKASMMVEATEKYVDRIGFASDSHFIDGKWTSAISDNDGLWTSMYGVGELMRYSVLKESKASVDEISKARKSALRSLKAVLLLGNIPGRTGTVDSKIRHLENTMLGDGNSYSEEYLKEGADFAIDNYPGSPADEIGCFGKDAQKTVNGYRVAGELKYSYDPINQEDWITEGEGAKTKRTHDGFFARTLSIPAIENTPYNDGIFIQRNFVDEDGSLKQKVMSSANRLYDFSKGEQPVMDLGNEPLPNILRDLLIIDGFQYSEKDIVYKADTSSDELIGHLFIYKVAFDILDENDPIEKELKELVKSTTVKIVRHMQNNNYQLVDATGYSTSWNKFDRDYFNCDFAFKDNGLNAVVLLSSYKLAYYMTGEKSWQDEYLLLAEAEPYRYADLAGMFWKQCMWLIGNTDLEKRNNKDDIDKLVKKLENFANASEEEKTRHAMYELNYSDEEMAMLGFYLLFQLETDEKLLSKYRKAIDAWWISISHSEYSLWNYIYQLAYPSKEIKDAYGNNILQTASWSLNRHPIDTRRYQAFISGARKDILDDNGITINPEKIIGKRTSKSDIEIAKNLVNNKICAEYNPENIYQIKVLPPDENRINKYNNANFMLSEKNGAAVMEPSTTYTLPYWMGRYHGMLMED